MAVRKWGKFTIIDLTDDEIATLNQPLPKSQGTFQDFMRHLQRLVNPATKEIKLTADDLEKIAHIAFDYGPGGYEERLLETFSRELGPKLGRE